MDVSECLAAPGLAEAAQRYGQPEVREYDLGDAGDEERFWEMWQKRPAEVVLAICRPGGRVLLQTKAFYPPGTYRLPSGGVREGEPLLEAVQREMLEETGLQANPQRFLGILCYRFRRGGRPQVRASYVFVLENGAGTPAPRDEAERISGFREVPLADLEAVAQQLEGMQGEWAPWGRFRALAHRFVAEAMHGPRCT